MTKKTEPVHFYSDWWGSTDYYAQTETKETKPATGVPAFTSGLQTLADKLDAKEYRRLALIVHPDHAKDFKNRSTQTLSNKELRTLVKNLQTSVSGKTEKEIVLVLTDVMKTVVANRKQG